MLNRQNQTLQLKKIMHYNLIKAQMKHQCNNLMEQILAIVKKDYEYLNPIINMLIQIILSKVKQIPTIRV